MATTSIPFSATEARSKIKMTFATDAYGAGFIKTLAGFKSVKAATAFGVVAHATSVSVILRMPVLQVAENTVNTVSGLVDGKNTSSTPTYAQQVNYCIALVPSGTSLPASFVDACLLPGATVTSLGFHSSTITTVSLPLPPSLSSKLKGALEDKPQAALMVFAEVFGKVPNAGSPSAPQYAEAIGVVHFKTGSLGYGEVSTSDAVTE